VTVTLPDPSVTTFSAPNPDETARQFLEAWQAEDFEAMYGLLSPLTRDGLSLESFREDYQGVQDDARIVQVEFQIVSSLVINPQQAEVRYRLSLQSAVVGEIVRETTMNMTRAREDEGWAIAWTRGNIMPELAEDRGLRLQPVTPTRANIYDRAGLALATQSEAVALAIVPNRIGGEEAEEAMLSTLRRLLDAPSNEDILFMYDDIRATDWYTPLGEVALSDFQLVEGTLASTGGVQWSVYDTRYYPGSGITPYGGGTAPHAVGYVSWIPAELLDQYLVQGYQQDAYVGLMGIERAYETELRGTPGGSLYLTSADGRDLQLLASRDPEPPYQVYTTLDRELQTYAQQAIENFVGAVVVLERDTGAVLALASSPGFDPNLFDTNNPNYGFAINRLLEDLNIPLLNRATVGLYPPGSVFKIITMAAALQWGGYTPDTVYNCGLEFRELPGIVLYDWRYEKELPAAGEITLVQGLERSCNPYFWHLGLDMYNQGQTTAIPAMAVEFGLGEETGIEIGEDAGLVPNPENKLARTGEEWADRDAVQMAIGQSFLQVTPLQVARFIAAVGNGGTLYSPQIIWSVESAEGDVLHTFAPEAQAELPLSAENLEAIQRAMINVVRDPNATAYRKFLGLDINVAGKTGTATTGDFTDPHAWFAGYTYEQREDLADIVVVVLLEYQGEGSDWAAPVFRRIIEAYFKGRPQSLYPWEARIRVERTPTPTPGPDEPQPEETPTP
jgi:penicillin-binding protein 2